MEGERRHRLSSIDLLPEEATAAVNFAITALEEGNRTDIDILEEFNAMLADAGLETVSKSAFNRYALKKRRAFRSTAQFRQTAAAFAQERGAADTDDMVTMLRHMLMTTMYEFIVTGRVKPKETMEMARAIKSLLDAQRASAQNRKQFDEEAQQKVSDAFDAAEEAMEKTGVDGKAVLASIRAAYGIAVEDET